MKSNLQLAALFLVLMIGLAGGLRQRAAQAAAPANALTVTPSKIEIELNTGDHLTRTLHLANTTADLVLIEAAIESFGNGADPELYQLAPYLKLEQAVWRLEPGATVDVPLTVTLPSKVLPGSRQALVVFQARVAERPGGSARALTQLGVPILLTVRGVTSPAGELKSFGLLGSHFRFRADDLTFYLNFANQGNVYLNPYGGITLATARGRVVATRAIDPWYVLPESIRLREIRWSPGWLLPGYYQATLEQNRGYDNVIDRATTGFWYLPLPLLTITALLLFGLLAWWLHSKLKVRSL